MSKKTEEEMSFLDHLEVMRWHLLRALAAVVIMALVAFVFKSIVFDTIILAPMDGEFATNRWLCNLGDLLGLKQICINQDDLHLQTINMAEQFSMHIIVSMVAGVVVAFPYVFYEIWSFVIPALHDQERSSARGAVFYTSLLFILGVLFGYYIISPLSVNFLAGYSVSDTVISSPTLKSYVQTITSVVLAAGVVFQLPILVYFLSKAGLVSPSFLKKYRRHALILIVTLSAIITPPDVFSQVLVAIPLMVLYEIGISISKRIMKQQAAEEEEYNQELARQKAARRKKAQEDETPANEEPNEESGEDSGEEGGGETGEGTAEESDEEEEKDETDPQPDPRTVKREEQSTKKPWKQKAPKKDDKDADKGETEN